MAQNLGLLCIAEGVETSQQNDFLKKLHCPEMQGFYFSRPLTSVDATALLRSAKLAARLEPSTAAMRHPDVHVRTPPPLALQ